MKRLKFNWPGDIIGSDGMKFEAGNSSPMFQLQGLGDRFCSKHGSALRAWNEPLHHCFEPVTILLAGNIRDHGLAVS